MDKSSIKNFAVSARVKLKEQIKQKAYAFGITKDEIKSVEMFEDAFEVNGNKYNKRLLKHRENLVKKINEKGFEQLLEEVAYTWFNRLIAIRFMEVNEYLPSGVRVLSSTDSSKIEPDIIREAANLDFENLNIDLIYKLQDENSIEELFKYLLIRQCNELGKIMPVVFEEIEDYTELLLPDNLLQEGSIVRDLVTSITEEDWEEQVEIIGWLYQYYISEKKDEVFADLKKNKKITKENIPAATQLFTPDWIVKYMVENSLGRLWLESHPDEELKSKWKYYLEEPEQEPEVMKELQAIRDKNKNLKPEDIKVIDCCMGSGHILVYQFDVLYDIYKSAGYSEREIPKLILEKNIYGLDIDDRAAQLAYFAVMMKARSYNRRIFRKRIDLNICSIQESNDFPIEAINFLVNTKETEIEKRIHREDIDYLIDVFNDAKEYGSILEVKEIDFDTIERRIEKIKNGDTNDIFEWQYKNIILERIPDLIKQAKIMSQKYEVVCTNPPYMGIRQGMNDKLKQYITKHYQIAKSDLFAVFMEVSFQLAKQNAYIGMINQHSWMFLKSFSELRKDIVLTKSIVNMLHLGTRAFEEIGGEVVQSTSFILQNSHYNYCAKYLRLINIRDAKAKEETVINIINEKGNNPDLVYYFKMNDYQDLPDNIIGYWVNRKFIDIFSKEKCLADVAKPRQGMSTSDNDRFLRLWFETDIGRIGFGYESREFAQKSGKKWFPYNKGGQYRKWYGNNNYVVNWENDGAELRAWADWLNTHGTSMGRLVSQEFYLKKGITWSLISSNKFGVRCFNEGMIFDVGSHCLFCSEDLYLFFAALLNTKISKEFLKILNPTLNLSSGVIANIPVVFPNDKSQLDRINEIVKQNISVSKEDWDISETSWDFKSHPFLKHLDLGINMKLSTVVNIWETKTEGTFQQLRYNEEELNRIFIEIYGLQDELTPDVDDKDITNRKADRVRDTRSFISYAIGCMFGRYSLDEEGLIYAGGEFDSSRYKTFKVDVDNVIPITDDEYFEDDIVSRFIEFLKITFSEETIEQNLDYIADTLGEKGNETSRQTIRRYFLKDFYKDHLRTYQKRPIYWLFDSGKNDGFKALIYMHRYDIDTAAIVRTDYLHLLQRKYEAEVNTLEMVMENSNESVREKTEAKKKKEKIQKQILECVQYDQVIAHVANQKVSIDLDDGVSVNYGKFQGIEVPQGEGKKPLKADLLSRI
ncbi:BREX-1 system adenine-specific DNA-methyltransferase PglX [Clostridium sp.]|jgi:hypothetical protein|uniref:BREX-1 system adenine-specific DNA-methyltransferase PglX n=1 Tax=Clostridium sp. TaxID=1506 RepID=UPI003EE8FB51